MSLNNNYNDYNKSLWLQFKYTNEVIFKIVFTMLYWWNNDYPSNIRFQYNGKKTGDFFMVFKTLLDHYTHRFIKMMLEDNITRELLPLTGILIKKKINVDGYRNLATMDANDGYFILTNYRYIIWVLDQWIKNIKSPSFTIKLQDSLADIFLSQAIDNIQNEKSTIMATICKYGNFDYQNDNIKPDYLPRIPSYLIKNGLDPKYIKSTNKAKTTSCKKHRPRLDIRKLSLDLDQTEQATHIKTINQLLSNKTIKLLYLLQLTQLNMATASPLYIIVFLMLYKLVNQANKAYFQAQLHQLLDGNYRQDVTTDKLDKIVKLIDWLSLSSSVKYLVSYKILTTIALTLLKDSRTQHDRLWFAYTTGLLSYFVSQQQSIVIPKQLSNTMMIIDQPRNVCLEAKRSITRKKYNNIEYVADGRESRLFIDSSRTYKINGRSENIIRLLCWGLDLFALGQSRKIKDRLLAMTGMDLQPSNLYSLTIKVDNTYTDDDSIKIRICFESNNSHHETYDPKKKAYYITIKGKNSQNILLSSDGQRKNTNVFFDNLALKRLTQNQLNSPKFFKLNDNKYGFFNENKNNNNDPIELNQDQQHDYYQPQTTGK